MERRRSPAGKWSPSVRGIRKKLDGDWTGIQGNFGPRGGMEDLSHLRKYNQIEELLADPDIDMVNICLPTYMHKSVSIAALQAGKHVLVEKPIEIRLDGANEVVQVGIESGKQFMVAHVLPFFAEFAYARQAVESGKYGELLGGHFKRVISQPTWTRDFGGFGKEWGTGDRSAYPRYALYPAALWCPGCGVLARQTRRR